MTGTNDTPTLLALITLAAHGPEQSGLVEDALRRFLHAAGLRREHAEEEAGDMAASALLAGADLLTLGDATRTDLIFPL